MKKAAPFGVAFFVFNPWDLGYFGRMKHAPIVLCLLFGFLLSRPALAQTSDEVELYLFDLPGVQFEAVPAPAMFESSWTLLVQQPLDHEHPELGSFRQKVYVSHFESDRPVVLVTEGYNRGRNYTSELAAAIGANQVVVEHRFYGASVPDSMDYTHLNIRQAAADLHRIKEMLSELYDVPWVASGISKGGQTTLYYRYLYPDDVAASAPYVAPINLALEDERIYDFLNSVGSRSCRKDILAIQRRILEDYDASLLRLKWHAKGEGLEFGYLSLEEAFEYAVLEYPFSFWQWGSDCGEIPDATEDIEEVLDHFLEVSGLAFFSNASMTDYASHYYQCAREFGYYSYETDAVQDLLRALPVSPNPSAIFTPNHDKIPYDGGVLAREVYDWLEASGDRIVYINGALDTWSATAMPPNEDRVALYFFMEDQSHRTARIANLDGGQKQQVKEALERWMGMPITGTLSEIEGGD